MEKVDPEVLKEVSENVEKSEPEFVDWSSFRREAAKDILCALIGQNDSSLGSFSFNYKAKVEYAVEIADNLIAELNK